MKKKNYIEGIMREGRLKKSKKIDCSKCLDRCDHYRDKRGDLCEKR